MSTKTLREAINHLDKADDNVTKFPIFKGVVAFKRNENSSTESLLRAIKKFYSQPEHNFQDIPDDYLGDFEKTFEFMRRYRVDGLHKMFTGLCVLDDLYMKTTFTYNSFDSQGYDQPVIEYYEEPEYFNLASSQFLKDLFSHLSLAKYAKLDNDDVPLDYRYNTLHANHEMMYDEEWFPPGDYSDYRKSPEAFREAYIKYLRWKEGNSSDETFISVLK
ncbi:hypothetical protein FUA23_21940 [Neolewinella aurantiaca]|uniref:Uncharacterized protein n=1 Tax=Neolewinella aurantiaca TaxID=2602767 RepID=A0A5C7F2R8_9BACT|nr:hypothetical protein FUA23_21940 [Neolewinella aurantiaca]